MKKFAVILMILFLLGVSAGCGGNPQPTKAPAEPAPVISPEPAPVEPISMPEPEPEPKPEPELALDEESIKNAQLAVITNAEIIEQDPTYKSLYPDMACWILENKSDYVIKNYTVSVLAYDENGYPVKVEGQFSYNPGFEQLVTGEAVNIQPGATYGHDSGYPLDPQHNIAYAIVVVEQLEFYDANTWVNPYYDIWVKKYKEKPVALEDLQNMYK